MRSHKLRVGQKVTISPGWALSAEQGGEYVVASLLSVGVNGPEYRLTKEGDSFDRIVAQNSLIACA